MHVDLSTSVVPQFAIENLEYTENVTEETFMMSHAMISVTSNMSDGI